MCLVSLDAGYNCLLSLAGLGTPPLLQSLSVEGNAMASLEGVQSLATLGLL